MLFSSWGNIIDLSSNEPKSIQTSLAHLPDYKQRQLMEITDIIVKAVDPEKVILFGSYAAGR
jgi:hypothetical protein